MTMNRFTRNKAILEIGDDRFEYIRNRENDGESSEFVLPENAIDESDSAANSVENSLENSISEDHVSGEIQNGKHEHTLN